MPSRPEDNPGGDPESNPESDRPHDPAGRLWASLANASLNR